MKKLAFALVTAARKLKSYFRAHTIIVLMDRPLRRAMSSPEAAGQMALWAVKLNEFDIQYRPRTAIKEQAVADFIVKFAQSEDKGEENAAQWNIHTDRSSNRRVRGAGVVIQTSEGDKIEYMI